MVPYWVRPGLALFSLLVGGLVVNIFYLQPMGSSRDSAGSTRAASPWSLQLAARTGEGAPSPEQGAIEGAELVRAVQRELQAKGYDAGTIDGVPGLMTRAAIMAFEADYGLPLTGEANEALLKQILLGGARPQEAPGAGADGPEVAGPRAVAIVKAVQRSLHGLGYAPGTVDGHLGSDTVRAIRAFEAAQKMPESGRISGQLIARLVRVGGQDSFADAR